jgi:PilZ domain-containing protein
MRAHRYPLELPLRYRSIGDPQWRTGTTANISRSGVLFKGETALGINTEIEVGLLLSKISSAADIIFRARVVRMEVANGNATPMLAAVFSNYRYERARAS